MHALEPRSPAHSVSRLCYLPALDGLRALAVLAVIGFHATLPFFGAGFLGVEVFFVVSGYLITSLLLAEQRATGRISLPHFWLSRARRLLPALFTLLLVALLLSRTLAPDSLPETRRDSLAALFYISNWWQILNGHSYFMDVDRPPLLLHLWSLAVEEQFYLFWPLAVALIGRKGTPWLLLMAIFGGAASALWMRALFDPSLDPTRVYVGSDTRLSGLLFGAALSIVLPAPLTDGGARPLPHVPDVSPALRDVLALSGFGALVWLLFAAPSHGSFLYRGGLVLVDIASAALISGLVLPTRLARGLGAKPLAWLGRRSYGLYLWHWPIFALTRPEFDLALGRAPLLALRSTLTFVAAELCYRFIELPIRNGAIRRARARPLAIAVCAALVATLAVAQVTLSQPRRAGARAAALPPHATPSNAQSLAVALPGPVVAESGPESVAAPIAELEPAALGVALDPGWPKTLTLLSDSVGLGLSQALPRALPGWRVEILGRPALMVKQVVPEFLNARAVGSVVVIALAYNSLFEKERKNYEHWSEVWDRGAERLLADLKACGGKKLVWITLREPSAALVTEAGRDQFERYAWFFPYVNERIRALAKRHPELALADWQAVSNVPDLTRDLIHLNPAGVTLMTDTITRAVLGPKPARRATP